MAHDAALHVFIHTYTTTHTERTATLSHTGTFTQNTYVLYTYTLYFSRYLIFLLPPFSLWLSVSPTHTHADTQTIRPVMAVITPNYSLYQGTSPGERGKCVLVCYSSVCLRLSLYSMCVWPWGNGSPFILVWSNLFYIYTLYITITHI